MPKFTDKERKIIEKQLFIEGERLFGLYGLKKVTVDDLVKAAGISKGSFYAFYTSKEHLFMDIISSLQNKMWADMDIFLEKNRVLPPRILTKNFILWTFKQTYKYPLLLQANSEIAEHLYRKLPKEVLEAHTQEDKEKLGKLQNYGVSFTCQLEQVTKTFQLLAMNYITMEKDNYEDKETIMEIMVNGIVKELVRETND